VTWSRSAKANIPGEFGTGFGRGGRCCAVAVNGTSIHGRARAAAATARPPRTSDCEALLVLGIRLTVLSASPYFDPDNRA
jgi:hypothetical protein